jgi:predicted dehydrogenase
MMNRRQLLKGLSMSVVTGALLDEQVQRGDAQISASDRVRVGVIGPGSRGLELIRELRRSKGAEIVAVADVYEPRFAEVNEMVGLKVPGHKDYRELLDRKDLDAVVIASPPLFHAQHTIAALESGRPVYEEKTMGLTPEDCYHVLKTVETTTQILQVGTQYRYASWVQESMKRVHAGEIGEPTHVYAYWHRADNWRRDVPDPSLEHLLNWRLYKESSGGLLTELGAHHVDMANWVFGEQPSSVMGTSGIVRYHDGRTVGDNVQAVFEYSKDRRLFFSSLTNNAYMADQIWIFGSEGSVQITVEDATFYGERRNGRAVPAHTSVVNRGLKTGASYASNWEMPYRGPGQRLEKPKDEEPTLNACKAFLRSVRTKQRPFADVQVGYAAAMAITMGSRAMEEKRLVEIPLPPTVA